MSYIIDSSCLIEAKNHYYDFAIHPGFWNWVELSNGDGRVHSIDQVLVELDRGDASCPLRLWANARKGIFLPIDPAASRAMVTVAQTVQGGRQTDAAKRKFLSGADPFLIAYALAHAHTVVSHEVHNPNQLSAVKIPTVCLSLNVPCGIMHLTQEA